jgi:nucleotide-binding universal stress UspA family protein
MRGKKGYAIFRRLVVLLDHSAPHKGAFSHALEWAWHLGLPIHAWALRSVICGANLQENGQREQLAPAGFQANGSDDFALKVNACANVCADWGVKLGLTPMEGDLTRWLQQHLEPDDLLMVSYAPVGSERFTLLRQVLQSTAAVLICPEAWKRTLSRMLVLYRSWKLNRDALATAMELCRWVRAEPVVLTVARTEREGRRLQQPARAAFADHGQVANFDLLIGAEVAEAAARVARWRQCQLLVMGRYGRPSWARWFGGSTTESLIALADSLAVLTIPNRLTSAGARKSTDRTRAVGEPFFLKSGGRMPKRKLNEPA